LICSVPDAVRWSSNGRPAPGFFPAPAPPVLAAAVADDGSSSSSDEARETKERTERNRCAGSRK